MWNLKKINNMNERLFKISLIFTLIISTGTIFSQSITGKVSSKNDPLIGASIFIKGTKIGVTTDFDGKYSIDGINANSVLVFSYIGFQSQEVLVEKKTVINVVLEESVEAINEIVVIGYGQSQSKRMLSTAVSTVNKKLIEDTPASRVENILQGAVPGVVVQQDSGAPGSGSTIRIRGVGSPNSSDPLYIVDGFPVPNLQHINPNEIKSLVVLKDAASTSVYGSRGSNGVILVETKTGRRNSNPSISISSYTGFQNMGYKPDLMNASEYINYYNQGVTKAGTNLNGNRPAFSEAERNILPDTNWYDAAAKTALMTNYAASITNGGEKFSYSISGGILDQDAIFSKAGKTNFNRKNIRASFNADVRENIQINLSADIAKMTNTNPITGIGNSNSLPSIYPTHAENGELFNPGRQNPKPQYKGVPLNVMGAMTNPLWALNDFGGYNNVRDVKNYGISGDWQPIKDMNVHASYNSQQNIGLERGFTPNLGAVYPEQNFFLVGSYYEAPSSLVKDQITGTIEYTFSGLKTAGHNLNVLAGYEQLEEKVTYGGSLVNVGDFLTTSFKDASFALASNPSKTIHTPNKIAEVGLISYFARVKYNFKEKYLATASLRNDRSSNFGQNYRSGFFPSFSLGWLLSEEAFLNESKFINLLKIRSSWGISGIDNSPRALAYLSTINNSVSYGESPALALTGLANPNLKWEELQQFNVGLDLSVFNNAVDISFDYYSKKTSDILLQANTPLSSGLSPSIVNIGGVTNSGLELAFTYKQTTENFSWNASLSLASNKNKVTNLGNDGQALQGGYTGALFAEPITLTAVGKPIGSFYGYQVEGMDANGNLLFKDLDGSGNDKRFPNLTDKTFIGKPLPDFNAGLNLGVTYHRFDLSTFFYAASGNDIFDATIAYTAVGSNRPASYLQEGAPRNMVVAAAGDSNGENLVSDFHIKDASFIKFKNVVFGYTLPKGAVTKLKADKIRFYVSGQNLFTLTKYEGVDPEVGGGILSMGIDTGFYPQSRSYLLGLQINF